MKEYGPSPFGTSTLVAFQKRFSEKDMMTILETSILETKEEYSSDDNSDPLDGRTLILDAAYCPADIAYSQEVNLLNEAREKPEQTVDEICKSDARRNRECIASMRDGDFLRLSKSQKRCAKAIRPTLRFYQHSYFFTDCGVEPI